MTPNFTVLFRPLRAVCLIVLLAICCSGCSDSDPVDTPLADQLALSPSSLTFDEQDPAKNVITVTATEGLTWALRLIPSAEGCKLSTLSGRGSGTLRIEEMPNDSSIDITAVHTYSDGTQLKSNSVRVMRGNAEPDPDKPSLELSVEKLTFDPDNIAVNIVEVQCNTTWSASTEDAELQFSPASGENDGVITVTAAPANKTSVITVTAGEARMP